MEKLFHKTHFFLNPKFVGHIFQSSTIPCVGMPEECFPVGTKRGRLSYTIYNEASGAKVEVLLKAKAFRVVKIGLFDKNGGLGTCISTLICYWLVCFMWIQGVYSCRYGSPIHV